MTWSTVGAIVGSDSARSTGAEALTTRRYTPEPVAFALRQAEAGTPVEAVCRKLGVSGATSDRWEKASDGPG